MNQTYPINLILPRVNEGRIELDGDFVRVGRFLLFYKKGLKCVSCSLEASFFRKEKSNEAAILNLYGLGKNGRFVLFTKDHIIPESRGGTKALSNLQPMCEDCNSLKGDFITFRDKVGQTIKALKSFRDGMKTRFKNTYKLLKAIWRQQDKGVKWIAN